MRAQGPHDRFGDTAIALVHCACRRAGRWGLHGRCASAPALARLPLSDTGSATAGGVAAALMLATSGLLASTGRAALDRGALAGVEHAFRAERDVRRPWRDARRRVKAGLADHDASGARYADDVAVQSVLHLLAGQEHDRRGRKVLPRSRPAASRWRDRGADAAASSKGPRSDARQGCGSDAVMSSCATPWLGP
jgi:hypothetical protein